MPALVQTPEPQRPVRRVAVGGQTWASESDGRGRESRVTSQEEWYGRRRWIETLLRAAMCAARCHGMASALELLAPLALLPASV